MSDASIVPITWASRNAIPDRYLVRLKQDADVESHLSWLEQHLNDGSSKCKVLAKFQFTKGYGAELSGPVLDHLTKRHDVKAITQDCRTELCIQEVDS